MYNLELERAVAFIEESKLEDGAKVALQLPDGLVAHSGTIIAELSSHFPQLRFIVIANTVYGACCIDDAAAVALNASVLIHFGHSELVPSSMLLLPVLYVRVTIAVDVPAIVQAISAFFPSDKPLALLSTAQYLSALADIHAALPWTTVPRTPGLSAGEMLGCTVPPIPDGNVLVVCDGRFHLEAIGIAYPDATLYRFDPFNHKIYREEFESGGLAPRVEMVERLRGRPLGKVGLLHGTLGRQGSLPLQRKLVNLIHRKGGEAVVVAMSLTDVDRVQGIAQGLDLIVLLSCPRLAIDWGSQFESVGVPVLTNMEFAALVDEGAWAEFSGKGYPLKNYSKKCNFGSAW
ncbi:Diphthamide synthesis DPH1/DPH2 [Carpediemonas membranifera]|uniref:2-(3-amino-3-carboxypropyl)histidine synthase subunit 1 n=1 Tax=Carpediemonas membranifera TaxID=201153 RepID=A0A8J6AV05_9EUKA|nr:Diphthamide synthesis DPH1/DPH2 [Carpediemonas membranifera]|eukprot:KAG9393185.1 Diphthamide synthesis DPH1/DPH2 [Carpediemonas membranifera]